MSGPIAAGHNQLPRRQGSDPSTLERHFGTTEVLPLWIAEPDVELAPCIVEAISARASRGWFGYETRPTTVIDAFTEWTAVRHGWNCDDLATIVSPSVGTSVGVLIDELTNPGDGVIIQPPVFTDFKTIISDNGRTVARNPLRRSEGRYDMDLGDLEVMVSEPSNRFLVLCNPHNPVGRVWTRDELAAVASLCAENDVFVLSDEIHADLALPPHRFTPFAAVAAGTGVRWAAAHGPIKTFGLAGLCDTLLITADDEVEARFRTRSSQFHLTRNNVFAIEAFDAAYRCGSDWLDDFLTLISANVSLLADRLPDEVGLITPEATYLAWLDITGLGLEVGEVPSWLASTAGLALSPGHWFGREGAGYARMTIGSDTATIERAVDQLRAAIS